MDMPSADDLRAGFKKYQDEDKRDAMYKIATFLVDHFWDDSYNLTNSIGVLLLTWNQAFYRYGCFDYEKLDKCLGENKELFGKYRNRNILDYSSENNPDIRYLFGQLMNALQICTGKKSGTKSPAGVVKALHLLAPRFFPLWDGSIAYAYGCYYSYQPIEKYIKFMSIIKQLAIKLGPTVNEQETGKSLIKLIDEYNFAKYTREWI
jgi:hypothetical protein